MDIPHKKDSINANTPFHLASMSKTLTGTTVLTYLLGDGKSHVAADDSETIPDLVEHLVATAIAGCKALRPLRPWMFPGSDTSAKMQRVSGSTTVAERKSKDSSPVPRVSPSQCAAKRRGSTRSNPRPASRSRR